MELPLEQWLRPLRTYQSVVSPATGHGISLSLALLVGWGMEFDWNNPPFNLNQSLTIGEIEESFEDPFAIRLLPDSARFSAQARYFNLGVSARGTGIFSVYHTNGKQSRVIFARPFESEERFFYERKLTKTLGTHGGAG